MIIYILLFAMQVDSHAANNLIPEYKRDIKDVEEL